MAKGLFSQGVTVLLSKSVSIHKIKEVLEQKYDVMNVNESSEKWEFSGPSCMIAYRPEVHGIINIDMIDRPWPDHMGDPKEEAILFGAWSMGHFGPHTHPGNLERASLQAWEFPDAKSAADAHVACIRVRVTYAAGRVNEETPILPEDYDSFPELLQVTAIARELLHLPEAICYFNPGGESLASDALIDELFERYEQTNLAPMELWSNIRMYNLPQEGWLLMDTVGMEQLDVQDQEIVFDRNIYDPNEAADFLRNIANYLMQNGPVIQEGDTIDGIGGVNWQVSICAEGLSQPAREVLHWSALDGKERPEGL